jgi:triacylglycerol esterase/lipase EstA (alpha/beta hydrolase family)
MKNMKKTPVSIAIATSLSLFTVNNVFAFKLSNSAIPVVDDARERIISSYKAILTLCCGGLLCFAYSLPVSALTDREQGMHAIVPKVSAKASASGPRTSPFDPEKQSDKLFVVDSDPSLDTGCTYRGGGPLQIHLPVRRVIGDVQKLIKGGVLKKDATLRLPAFDVDIHGSPQDASVPPEVDKIYFNGHVLSPDALSGDNQVWQLNLFKIPVDWINFPSDPGQGQTVSPADNIIKIDIDTASPSSDQNWCTSVDWVELSLDISAVPVVFVHGLNSNGNTWIGSQVVDQVNIIGLPNSGAEVSLGRILDNFVKRLPILTTYIDAYKKRWGVDQLTLVGHSRGGLDSRNYISSPGGAKSILQIVQFGTPNAGTPFAPNPGPGNIYHCDGTIPELSEACMATFNTNHPFPSIVGLASIPGHAQTATDANMTDCGSLLNGMNGKNRASDGTVPVSSVHALPVGVDVPAVVSVTPGNRTACHTNVHRDTSAGITSAVGYIKNPKGVVAVQKSRQIVQNSNSKIAKVAATTANSSFSYPLSFNFSEQAVAVNNGSTGEFSFPLPGAIPITVNLVSEAATFDATFTTPAGTVLQPGTGVEINSGVGLFGPQTLLSLDAAHAVAGTWKVSYKVTGIDPSVTQSSIGLTVASDSDHSLAGTFSQSPEFLKATQSGTVAVSLLNGSTPIRGAAVILTLASGNITLVESTTTQGSYEAPITVTTAGTHSGELSVISAGKTSYAGIVLNILPASTALGTALTDQGISNSTNGLYDLLDVNVPVTVDKTQHYRLNGTLRTSSGKIITAEAEADLKAGASSIHLQFDGNAIYNTGDNGPYTIENIKLFTFPDGLSSKLIDVLDLSYQTSSYAVGSFQHKAVSIDATQNVTSNTSDTNQDGKLDHLQVTIPILSTAAAASFYNWSASLYDANGLLLSLASNRGTIATGKSTITLDFDVSTIGPNAIDGPFLLGGFLLYGQSTLSQNSVALITTPSINQFVGFTPCSLSTTDVPFPDTKLPNKPIAQVLPVTNTGTARCVLTGIDINSNDFTVAPSSSFPIIMEAGGATSFSVALVNATLGSHTAIIKLAASGNQSVVTSSFTTANVVAAVKPGDLNGDGIVNCADMAMVKASFGKGTGQVGFDTMADVNKDGVVDIRDLSYVSRLLSIGVKCS